MADENKPAVDAPDQMVLHGSEGNLTIHFRRPPVYLGLRLRRAMASCDLDLVGAAALYHSSAAVQKHVRRHDQIARLGDAVLQWLTEAGVPDREQVQAGEIALWRSVKDLPSLEVASSVAGFSAPTKDERSG